MKSRKLTPSICLGCLAAYVEGKLHYKWVDLEDVSFDPESLQEFINDEILGTSPVMNPEEWHIQDYQDFGGLTINEYESLDRVCELARLIDEHGIAYGMYADNVGIEYANESDFMDSYRGLYDSPEDYAQQLLEDCYNLEDNLLSNYIDIKAFVRDLGYDGYHFEFESGVGYHVFSQ